MQVNVEVKVKAQLIIDQNSKTYSLFDSLKNMRNDSLKQKECSSIRTQEYNDLKQQECGSMKQQGYSGLPEKNYSCTCVATNNNDSTLTLDYSTLKNSLMKSFAKDTCSDTMSYFNPNSLSVNSLSSNDYSSLWIVM